MDEEKKNIEESPLDKAMNTYNHMVKMGFIDASEADYIAKIIDEGKDTLLSSEDNSLNKYIDEAESNIRYSGYVSRLDYIKLFSKQIVGAARNGDAVIFPLTHKSNENYSEKIIEAAKKMTPEDISRVFGYQQENSVNNSDERFYYNFFNDKKRIQPSTVNKIIKHIEENKLYAKKKPMEYDSKGGRMRVTIDESDDKLFAKKKAMEYDSQGQKMRMMRNENDIIYALKESIEMDIKSESNSKLKNENNSEMKQKNRNGIMEYDDSYLAAMHYLYEKEEKPLMDAIMGRIIGIV